ncbi:MAG: hypothetical protein AB1757_18905 [Acidobacteriota bacterium]
MKKIFFTILFLLAFIFSSQGQTADKKQAQRKSLSLTLKSPQPSKEANTLLQKMSFYAIFSSLYDTNIEHDETNIRSLGAVFGLGTNFKSSEKKPAIEMNYEVAKHLYTRTNRWDVFSHNFEMRYNRSLNQNLSFSSEGEVAIRGNSDDRELSNQYIFKQAAKYRFNSANRLGLFGGYRFRRYDEIGRNANNPFVGAEFSHRLGENQTIKGEYRYEKNRAIEPRNRYIRRTYSLEFNTRLFGADKLIIEGRWRPQTYKRIIKVDKGLKTRRDERWVCNLAYEFMVGRNIELMPFYKFENRQSNDPDKFFNAHLAGFSLRFNF